MKHISQRLNRIRKTRIFSNRGSSLGNFQLRTKKSCCQPLKQMGNNASFLCCREGAPHSLMLMCTLTVGKKFPKLFTCSNSLRIRGFTAMPTPSLCSGADQNKSAPFTSYLSQTGKPWKEKLSPVLLPCIADSDGAAGTQLCQGAPLPSPQSGTAGATS